MPNWNGDWIEVKSYDVEQSGSAGVGDSGGLEVRMEYDTGTPITRHIAMLFSTTGVTGTVASATLTLNIDGTDLPTGDPGTSLNVRVYAVDEGDTLSLPTTIEDYAALPRTTAYASRSFYGEDATTSLDINVASVVQEVFDRVDWFSGAGIALLIEIQSGSAQPYYLTLQSIDPSSLDINTATIVDCATGSFVLTGNAATFNNQSTLVMATGGPFVLTGQPATFNASIPLALGTFVLTGQPAAFDASLSVSMAVGTFALSGQTTRVDVNANLGTGTFTCGAGAVTFPNTRAIIAATGTFTLTGVANNWTTSLALTPGTFTLTGVAAAIGATSTIDCAAGSFTLTGVSNTWVTSLSIATGTFTLSGVAAGVEASRVITAENGTFVVTGEAATFGAVYPLVCGTGEFVMMGYGMAFDSTGVIDALPGVFSFTGSDAAIPVAYTWSMEAGSFSLTGVDAGVGWVQPFNLETTSFTLSGQAAAAPATYMITALVEEIVVTTPSMNFSNPTAAGGGSVFSKKKALLDCNCGCTGACQGCCMPVDEEGVPIDIPFEISAPGCSIDGLTGVFNPLALDGANGPCGLCGIWGYSAYLDIPGEFYNPSGVEGEPCDLVPGCIQTFCMILACQSTPGAIDNPSQNLCCRRLRLQVWATFEFPGASILLPTQSDCPGDFYREFNPRSCSCQGGVSALFEFNLYTLTKNSPLCGNVPECVLECDANISLAI